MGFPRFVSSLVAAKEGFKDRRHLGYWFVRGMGLMSGGGDFSPVRGIDESHMEIRINIVGLCMVSSYLISNVHSYTVVYIESGLI